MNRKIWDTRIEEAMKRGKFLNKDKTASGQWTCCSVSERDIIPDDKGYFWVMKNLRTEVIDLGNSFDNAVVTDKVELAKKIHQQIKSIPEKEMLVSIERHITVNMCDTDG